MLKIFSGKQDIYIEVADRYRKYIELGVLKEGEKLPSVRACAEELRVNPNTVQKAYAILEEEGLIYSLPKKGVFVAAPNGGAIDPPRDLSALTDTVRTLRASGYTEEELGRAIKEVYGI